MCPALLKRRPLVRLGCEGGLVFAEASPHVRNEPVPEAGAHAAMVGVGVVGHEPRLRVRGELQHEEVVVVALGRPVEHGFRLRLGRIDEAAAGQALGFGG